MLFKSRTSDGTQVLSSLLPLASPAAALTARRSGPPHAPVVCLCQTGDVSLWQFTQVTY